MKAVIVKRVEFNPEWLDDSGLFNNCPFPPKGEKWYGEYIITPDNDGLYNLPGGKARLTNVNRAVSMYAKFQMTNTEILHSTFYNYSGEDAIKESDLVAAVVVIYRFAISIRLGTWNGNSRPSKMNAVETWGPVLCTTDNNPAHGYYKSWITKGGMGTSFTYPRSVIPLRFTANKLCFWTDVTDMCSKILDVTNPIEPVDTGHWAAVYAKLMAMPTVTIMASERQLSLCKELAILRHQLFSEVKDKGVALDVLTDLCDEYNKATLAVLFDASIDIDNLSGAEIDVLHKLGTYGPQEDGDLPSKAGAADLIELGYMVSDYSCKNNNQLTELGKAAYHKLVARNI